jgi:hypothetical protein
MTAEDIVMVIDKPHFIVKLHTTLLEVDLKEGVKKELEDVIEAKPILRESLGLLFQTIVPLDVRLKDIRSASVDKKGYVKIDIPHRKDITIPLKPDESRRLVDKLNELIPIEKERAIRDLEEAQKEGKEFEPKRAEFEAEAYRERVGRV